MQQWIVYFYKMNSRTLKYFRYSLVGAIAAIALLDVLLPEPGLGAYGIGGSAGAVALGYLAKFSWA